MYCRNSDCSKNAIYMVKAKMNGARNLSRATKKIGDYSQTIEAVKAAKTLATCCGNDLKTATEVLKAVLGN